MVTPRDYRLARRAVPKRFRWRNPRLRLRWLLKRIAALEEELALYKMLS